jgi:hypothetical protein
MLEFDPELRAQMRDFKAKFSGFFGIMVLNDQNLFQSTECFSGRRERGFGESSWTRKGQLPDNRAEQERSQSPRFVSEIVRVGSGLNLAPNASLDPWTLPLHAPPAVSWIFLIHPHNCHIRRSAPMTCRFR